ncbi:type IV secretory system conjugative DNA transfer family protein [Cetobacterium somerae]
MKKFKKILMANFFMLIMLNNLFMFTLANKYKNLDNIITPLIVLNKNKRNNSEGIYLSPNLLLKKELSSSVQDKYKKGYVFLSLAIIFLFFYKKKIPITHGSASFATIDDIEEMGITNSEDGVILGMTKNNKILAHNGPEHLMAMAPTRSGKGINTVLPTLWTWVSSVIINDIKGECWDLTSGYRRSQLKQKCYYFNPVDETGEGISYNPLALVNVGQGSEQEDARVIATTLLDVENKGETDHWISSAINLLVAVILHVKYVNKEASFIEILNFMEDPNEPLIDKIGNIIAKELNKFGDVVDKVIVDENGEIIQTFEPFNHYEALKNQGVLNRTFRDLYNNDTELHPIVGKTFMTIFGTPDKERGSIFSTCSNKLGVFKDSRILKNISKSDILPKDLMKNRISLYLITPPKAINMTKPLFRLIITQTIYELTEKMEFNNRKKIYKELMNKISLDKIKKTFKQFINEFLYIKQKDLSKEKNKRLLFLIDEFPALGNLSLLEQALAYVAGYGLKVLMITQSINQLRKIYGRDNSVLDNTHVQIYFTPNDTETPKMISEALGNKTEKVITKSGKGMLLEQRSESYHARALMTPSEVRTMPFEEVLIFVTTKKPIHGKKIMWWKLKRFKNNANYNIPYRSYIKLCEKLEENLLDEYVAEYLIYLKGSYKALKILINTVGLDKFILEIIQDEKLSEELIQVKKEIEKLNEEEKKELKVKILSEIILKSSFGTIEEYENEIKEYLVNFSDEDLLKYMKLTLYKNLLLKKERLEKILETNLLKMEDNLAYEQKMKIEIIETLKKGGIRDSLIPDFIENLDKIKGIDKEHYNKILEILKKKIEKTEDGEASLEIERINISEIEIENFIQFLKTENGSQILAEEQEEI